MIFISNVVRKCRDVPVICMMRNIPGTRLISVLIKIGVTRKMERKMKRSHRKVRDGEI